MADPERDPRGAPGFPQPASVSPQLLIIRRHVCKAPWTVFSVQHQFRCMPPLYITFNPVCFYGIINCDPRFILTRSRLFSLHKFYMYSLYKDAAVRPPKPAHLTAGLLVGRIQPKWSCSELLWELITSLSETMGSKASIHCLIFYPPLTCAVPCL